MNRLAIIGIILSLLGLLVTFIGYKLRKFDEAIEDIFKDAFNQKENECTRQDKGTDK